MPERNLRAAVGRRENLTVGAHAYTQTIPNIGDEHAALQEIRRVASSLSAISSSSSARA
jgi:hypothetical protein